MNPDIPIYIGSGNEATVRRTGERADGWLPLGYAPGTFHEYKSWLEEGFERAGNGKGFHNFEIQASVHVEIDDDVQAAALYIGGMGARDKNFYNDYAKKLGFESAAVEFQNLFLSGKGAGAVAAVPDGLVDAVALVGPKERIVERLSVWKEAAAKGHLATLVARRPSREAIRILAEGVL